jgi:hypothetical protein
MIKHMLKEKLWFTLLIPHEPACEVDSEYYVIFKTK